MNKVIKWMWLIVLGIAIGDAIWFGLERGDWFVPVLGLALLSLIAMIFSTSESRDLKYSPVPTHAWTFGMFLLQIGWSLQELGFRRESDVVHMIMGMFLLCGVVFVYLPRRLVGNNSEDN